MTRAVLIACVLFLACERADELLVAGIQAVLEEPPVKLSGHAVDCARGADRMAAPHMLLTVDCSHLAPDGGVR